MIVIRKNNNILTDYINATLFFRNQRMCETRGLCDGLHDIGEWFLKELETKHKDEIKKIADGNLGDEISFQINRGNFIVNDDFKVNSLTVSCKLTKNVGVTFDSDYEAKDKDDRKEVVDSSTGEIYNDVIITLSVEANNYGDLITYLVVSFEHEMLHAYVDCLMAKGKLMSVVGKDHNYQRKSFSTPTESHIKGVTRNFLYKTSNFERGATVQQTSRELSSMDVPYTTSSDLTNALKQTTAYKDLDYIKKYVADVEALCNERDRLISERQKLKTALGVSADWFDDNDRDIQSQIDDVERNLTEVNNLCSQNVKIFNMLSERSVADIKALRKRVGIIFVRYMDKMNKAMSKVAYDVREWRIKKDLHTREERKTKTYFK